MIGGAIAWLLARGLSPLLAWVVLGGIALVALLGVTWSVHRYWDNHVAEPYRVEGDLRTEKKLRPEIELQTKRADLAERRLAIAMEANLTLTEDIEGPGGLRDQVKVSAETIERISKLAEQARATARRLLAQIAEQSKRDAAEITRLRALAAGPPLTVQEACDQADRILTDLAKWVRS